MPKRRRSRALFVKADGSPMLFSLVPCSERKEIRELIEYGGGVLVQPEKVPDAIRLVPSSVTVTDSSDVVFSANYIRACAKSDKLLRLIEFKIPMAPAVVDASDSKTRRLRSTRSRREYTLGEEIAIAEFVAKKPGVRVHGNAVYKEMASAGVVPGKHSWQSLKEHYLKNIFPVKHLYESPHEVNVLSGKQRSESAGDQGSSPLLAAASGVIVEDSDSEAVLCNLGPMPGVAEVHPVVATKKAHRDDGAGTGKNHSPSLGTGAEVEDLDSTDEDLPMEALVQEAALRNLGPMPGVAEVHPVGATKEAHRDNRSDPGSPASTVSAASTVFISDSGHSPDEDSTPESEQDDVSKVRRRLVRVLAMLREGKNTESHERCPADCGCPRSTRYIRTFREAISLSAFLAYHGEPLPSESPGIEDPEIAMLLEILLRDREGRD
ncbi:hypothetical protein V5799_010229 [Amblyomma americanum]|uniref:Telomeric repeat-binding factor 2-interacting protein 1 n=1 Tax=Amblyomma americanum TaxID=6943 RepID=A0AAQ4F8J8_AMBAM